jgi:hypothetical protein
MRQRAGKRASACHTRCVWKEYGLKVNPRDLAVFILLCEQDVGNKVVPVEEPSLPEDIQDVEDRGGIGFLNP